ncbi:MAG: hypothetical protein QHI48_00555 [Bacteroidota bacterium]|nr:hypothetical protein [Bacteroidota bacterium]
MLAFLPSFHVKSQRAAGETCDIDPLFLIDTPIAGILPTTSGSVEAAFQPDDGLLVSVVYGLRKNLNVGMSFGARRLLGSGKIIWNSLPGVMIRYRVFEESTVSPAFVIGFDTQGKDGYIPEDRQYAVKGPGIFTALSKNYTLLGSICFHGGINYSIEREDGDWHPNIFAGLEKTVGPITSILLEYNFAFDNDKKARGFWNGNLGIGCRVATKIGFNIDFLLKNILESNPYFHGTVRQIKIQYVRYI